MEPIIINPFESQNEKSFSDKNFIHKDDLNRAIAMISDIINGNYSDNSNNTITILGSRGSGKTSFIMRLLDEYKDSKEVFVLPMIDPTKIEEKAHVFVTILSLLDQAVQKHFKKGCSDPTDINFQKRASWKELLKDMAAGLPYIDGIYQENKDWQDEEFIMENGLRRVHSAINLKANFEKLVKQALEIIGDKKVLMIAFDDIDIDFRKGWLVMETIRKYLCVSCIIPIVSGDITLMVKGVRKQQWKNFGKALVKNEGEYLKRMEEYDDIVTRMENQYIQKVLPTSHWITITTIMEKILKDKTFLKNIKVPDDNGNEESLVKFFVNKLLFYGISNGYQLGSYLSYIYSLPLRMQLQIIIAMMSKNNSDILNPFVSSLIVNQIQIDILKSNKWRITKELMALLINKDCLDEAYQALPTMDDSKLNDCLFALGTSFSINVKDNPYLIFDYLQNLGNTRNLLTIMPLKNDANASIFNLFNYSEMALDCDFRIIASRKEAYVRSVLNSQNSKTNNFNKNWGGTIVLPGLAAKRKQNEAAMADRIDSVFKGKPFTKQCLAYMPLMLAQFGRKQQSLTLYSPNLILSSIGEILRYCLDESVSLNQLLYSFAQIRSFVMPGFNDSSEIEDKDVYTGDEDEINTEQDEIFTELITNIKDWGNKSKDISVAPYLLGKISTRIFYAFRNIDDMQTDDLGKAMQIRIIIILNSVLVEEAKELYPDIHINNNNPRTSEKFFHSNIKALKENSKKLRLSKMFMTCPLLTAYLNLSGTFETDYKSFIENETMSSINIYSELSEVKTLSTHNNGTSNTQTTP